MVEWQFHPRPQSKPIPSKVIEGAPSDGINGFSLNLKGKTSELIKKLGQGQRLEQLHQQLKGTKAYFAFSRLHPDKPSRAVVKDSAGIIHYDENRTYTIGEYKRLSSFPDDFIFIGSFSNALNRIGNSVPPNLIRAIAENIKGAPFMENNNPTVISTFAGAGGSSLGYKLAGFKELLAVEWDNNAVETFRLNFPEVPVYHGDIAALTGDECMKLAGVGKGELDVLDGSPPCQGFSTAGKRKFDDPRNSLFMEYARLVDELQPKVFVMENVTGMVKGYMKQAYLQIVKTLRACGYQVKGQVMNAMYYNVPQSRERVIIIGVRSDIGIEPSHPKPQGKPIPVKEAIKDIYDEGKKLTPEANKYYNMMKPGESASKYHPKGHLFGLIKLNPNKPSPTLTRSAGASKHVHWKEERFIGVKERAAIGSFPKDFKWSGSWVDIYNSIGNSVPPNLMRAIAQHIKINILEKT